MQSTVIFLAIGDEAVLRSSASTPLVSETSIRSTFGPIERRIEVVARQRPLAQEAVVGLQRFSRLLVLDDFIDATTQALHHSIVHHFAPRREFLRRELRPAIGRKLSGKIAADLGPEIANEIRLTRL